MEREPAGPAAAGGDILRDERLSWLALHADAPLVEIASAEPDFTDADAVAAMEYAKDKLARGGSLLILPGQERSPRSEAGEAVRRGLDECRFERSVLLAAGGDVYTTEEKLRVLARLIPAARSFARTNPSGRTYLDRLAEQFSAFRKGPDSPKIETAR